MPNPLTYQQALESGHKAFWVKLPAESWDEAMAHDAGNVKDWLNDEPYHFLPIPTPEELLSEVEVEVSELFTFHSDCVDAVELPEDKFTKGDRVRVRKVKNV